MRKNVKRRYEAPSMQVVEVGGERVIATSAREYGIESANKVDELNWNEE